MSDNIEALAGFLKSKNFVIAFTGAGISTESGIPDFRSKGDGLWEKIDPELISVRTLRQDPEKFFRYFQVLDETVSGKTPNAGHKALAELARLRVVRAVITQNIDGLHQAAGSKRVFEIHGNLTHCSCLRCKQEYPYSLLRDEMYRGNVPTSPCCGAVLRPSVILFGDKMPADFAKAQEEAFRADFALVVGTSLTVYPAAQIPEAVGQYAILNRDDTPLDVYAVERLRGPIGETLTALVEAVKKLS